MTGRPAKALLAPGTLLLAAAYPLAVYALLERGMVRLAGLLLVVVVAARLLLPEARRGWALGLVAIAGAFAAATGVTGSELLARLYPVGVSLALLAAFGATLLAPPSMIERIARATGATLDEHGVRYTRRLTVVWCGFFLVNGLIALLTALYASREWWALWNGLLSYLVAGTLFFGERLVRPRIAVAAAGR